MPWKYLISSKLYTLPVALVYKNLKETKHWFKGISFAFVNYVRIRYYVYVKFVAFEGLARFKAFMRKLNARRHNVAGELARLIKSRYFFFKTEIFFYFIYVFHLFSRKITNMHTCKITKRLIDLNNKRC